MSRYTHIIAGQESEAVARLPDLSSRSSQQQAATGTDNMSVDAAENGSKKLTPKSTLTAYPECNQSSTLGKEQDDSKENSESDNSFDSGILDSESLQLSTV